MPVSRARYVCSANSIFAFSDRYACGRERRREGSPHHVILSGVKRSRSFVSMRAKPRNEVTKGSRYPIPPRFHLRCCFAVRLRFAPLRMTRWGKAREEQAPPLRVVEGADPYNSCGFKPKNSVGESKALFHKYINISMPYAIA